jgi:hypothetical protein
VRRVWAASSSAVGHLFQCLMIVVMVVVGWVGVNGGVGVVRWERGRMWWTLVVGDHGSWSELLVVVWWLWFECQRRDGDHSWVELPSPFPFDMDGSCRC